MPSDTYARSVSYRSIVTGRSSTARSFDTIHTAGFPSFWKMAVDGSEMLGAPPTRACVTLTVMPSRKDGGGFTMVVRTWYVRVTGSALGLISRTPPAQA